MSTDPLSAVVEEFEADEGKRLPDNAPRLTIAVDPMVAFAEELAQPHVDAARTEIAGAATTGTGGLDHEQDAEAAPWKRAAAGLAGSVAMRTPQVPGPLPAATVSLRHAGLVKPRWPWVLAIMVAACSLTAVGTLRSHSDGEPESPELRAFERQDPPADRSGDEPDAKLRRRAHENGPRRADRALGRRRPSTSSRHPARAVRKARARSGLARADGG